MDPLPDPARPGDASAIAGSGAHEDRSASTYDEIVVVVVRSGGIAGLTREWRAEPPPAQAPDWASLIEQCPWDAAAAPRSGAASPGADRFVWDVQARCGGEARGAELGDADVVGPWERLIDAVRDFGRAPESPPPRPH